MPAHPRRRLDGRIARVELEAQVGFGDARPPRSASRRRDRSTRAPRRSRRPAPARRPAPRRVRARTSSRRQAAATAAGAFVPRSAAQREGLVRIAVARAERRRARHAARDSPRPRSATRRRNGTTCCWLASPAFSRARIRYNAPPRPSRGSASGAPTNWTRPVRRRPAVVSRTDSSVQPPLPQ